MIRRRFLYSAGAAALTVLSRGVRAAGPPADGAASLPNALDASARAGHLVIIGGAEDRKNDMVLLRKFVELTGVRDPAIIVLTAASAHQDDVWEVYEPAFRELGVKRLVRLEIGSRTDANDAALAKDLHAADGIFITGGDQQRLMSTIGGTLTAMAIADGFSKRGICIGGTSAGAAAMSAHMMAEGQADGAPGKGVARMSAGLGFVPGAIIDQHFSERQRLGRLLALVAQAPFLLGIGIDEDTALVIEKGRGIEVIGQGAVTIVDGRKVVSNFFDVGNRELLEMLNIRLHLLPGGARYYLLGQDGPLPDRDRARHSAPTGGIPESLAEIVSILVSR